MNVQCHIVFTWLQTFPTESPIPFSKTRDAAMWRHLTILCEVVSYINMGEWCRAGVSCPARIGALLSVSRALKVCAPFFIQAITVFFLFKCPFHHVSAFIGNVKKDFPTTFPSVFYNRPLCFVWAYFDFYMPLCSWHKAWNVWWGIQSCWYTSFRKQFDHNLVL